MEVHLIHALILTPYESSLINATDWNEICAQDFTVHALYCKDSGGMLFHSDNQNSDCANEISKIQQTLAKCGISFTLSKQIIILSDDECEYCVEDVRKHFNH